MENERAREGRERERERKGEREREQPRGENEVKDWQVEAAEAVEAAHNTTEPSNPLMPTI